MCVCCFTNERPSVLLMNCYNQMSQSWRAGKAGFLLYDFLPLHLRAFSDGGVLDADSENVNVGATHSSVIVCWEGKNFQFQTHEVLYEDRPLPDSSYSVLFLTSLHLAIFLGHISKSLV